MELVGSGREADVFALDSGRVLRRYRNGAGAGAEAEMMAYLGGLGFPVPRVFEVSGADMILERLDGPTMLGALGDGRLTMAEGAGILADLQRRLHGLPARLARQDGDRILHRDLHPDNVMLTTRGPVVIDWHNAAEGPPAVDVCLTAVILAQVAAAPDHPHAAGAAAFLTSFLALTGTAMPEALAEAIEIRRADPALTPAESETLAATVTPLIRAALPAPLPPSSPPPSAG
ncbi:phosphotransferase [Actinoplanes couchii]|uniref:Aminoglycoside phosphotransferase domain-containing protein n=1 Tax=Actinoplanes couchii TaxID=403638 RepID=A0ABQ3XFG3_9ACTN|nr:phosphotransferase [Actinoplanes couchii]GID57239.1 hypothetical protein Aco03nite_056430 [Actinoplanes couchii]